MSEAWASHWIALLLKVKVDTRKVKFGREEGSITQIMSHSAVVIASSRQVVVLGCSPPTLSWAVFWPGLATNQPSLISTTAVIPRWHFQLRHQFEVGLGSDAVSCVGSSDLTVTVQHLRPGSLHLAAAMDTKIKSIRLRQMLQSCDSISHHT